MQSGRISGSCRNCAPQARGYLNQGLAICCPLEESKGQGGVQRWLPAKRSPRLPARVSTHRLMEQAAAPLATCCCWNARMNGSAERWRKAIARALVSGKRKAGEAHAEHRPGRRLRDRGDGELKVARPGPEHTLPYPLRHQERQEIASVLGVVDAKS